MTTPLHKLVIPSTGYYCLQPGREACAPALFVLHGYAQTAPEFLSLLRGLVPPEWAVVAPQGFHQKISHKDRSVTFSWMSPFERQDNIERNHRFLNEVADRLAAEEVIDRHRIVALGFSQGSSVAYRWAHCHPERVRGVVSVCADLPPDVEANLAPLKKTPVLVVYADQDRFFPVEIPQHAVQTLGHAGVDVRAVPFEGDHQVPPLLASELQSWLESHSF